MNIINFDFGFARELAWCVEYLKNDAGERFATLDDLFKKVVSMSQMDELAKDPEWAASAKNVVWIAATTLGLTY